MKWNVKLRQQISIQGKRLDEQLVISVSKVLLGLSVQHYPKHSIIDRLVSKSSATGKCYHLAACKWDSSLQESRLTSVKPNC